jgi:phosphatidylinositol alpha-mannosyltransferase
MKIGLVCPYNMLELAGGVAEVVINLRDGLSAKGHEVKIITPRPSHYKGVVPAGYILLGTSTNLNVGLATRGELTYRVDSDDIKDMLAREKFDVINFHEPWIPILARQILQFSTTTHVGTFHANLVDSTAGKSLVKILKYYGRNISDKLDYITAVSTAPAKVLIEKDPKRNYAESICYIPNGINIERYREKAALAIKHPKMKTILFVGRLESRKGLKHLLRAYQELIQSTPDVQLLIAGSGTDEQKLREYVKEFEIPRVTFLGFISEEDKVNQLHRADVFCSPATKGESFGIVLLEAMAAGCPVVAGDNVGYASVMKETGALSLVNPKDSVDFARRLEIMLFNDDIRQLWQTWAKAYVQQYDYPKVVDQYETAYEEAIQLHGKRPAQKSRFTMRRTRQLEEVSVQTEA